MKALKGYRTLAANGAIILTAIVCFALDMFDKGTASGLVLAALANMQLRTVTDTPVGQG